MRLNQSPKPAAGARFRNVVNSAFQHQNQCWRRADGAPLADTAQGIAGEMFRSRKLAKLQLSKVSEVRKAMRAAFSIHRLLMHISDTR
jgi:hypothetical protein